MENVIGCNNVSLTNMRKFYLLKFLTQAMHRFNETCVVDISDHEPKCHLLGFSRNILVSDLLMNIRKYSAVRWRGVEWQSEVSLSKIAIYWW